MVEEESFLNSIKLQHQIGRHGFKFYLIFCLNVGMKTFYEIAFKHWGWSVFL